MGSEKPTSEQARQHVEAVRQITEAHRILSKLREEMQKYPASREAVSEAVQKLEMALAILSVKTGGML